MTPEEKLKDTMLPGVIVELDAEEADEAGAFEENALNVDDALDSAFDDEA